MTINVNDTDAICGALFLQLSWYRDYVLGDTEKEDVPVVFTEMEEFINVIDQCNWVDAADAHRLFAEVEVAVGEIVDAFYDYYDGDYSKANDWPTFYRNWVYGE